MGHKLNFVSFEDVLNTFVLASSFLIQTTCIKVSESKFQKDKRDLRH